MVCLRAARSARMSVGQGRAHRSVGCSARPGSPHAGRPGAPPSKPGLRQQCRTVLPKLSARRGVPWWVPAAGGGSGGNGAAGGGGSGGGSGSGGGGGGDDDQPSAERKPVVGWKGWQDRVAADPQFVYKVMIEQVIGVTANVLGDMATRPNWGLNELDFVFATLVVGSIINFAAVYLLAPVPPAPGGAAAASLATKVFGDYYLNLWGAPPGHAFQPGFGLGARLVNLTYKGAVFAFIGMCAGTVGTATSNGLLALRKKLDPSFHSPNTPPTVLGNASCWALHMGVSANLRYQMINGLDMALQPLLPTPVFRVYTSIIRGLNNLAGGMSFVMTAKALGVQKAAEPQATARAEQGKKAKKA